MIKHLLALFIAASLAMSAVAQDQSVDLRNEWHTYRAGAYVPYTTGHVDAIYLSLKNGQSGEKLRINSSRPYFVFVNGIVIGEYRGLKFLSLDSLQKATQSVALMLSIYQDNIKPGDLTTFRQKSERANKDLSGRPPVFFYDFATVSGMIIIILFVLTIRLNPKLGDDYLSPAKIFSIREADDSQSSARLTSSSNIQFYLIVGMLFAFFLMIVFRHLPVEYRLSSLLQSFSFGQAIGKWFITTLFLLLIFAVKIILIFSLTRLFGLKGLARVHYFNWIRMLLIVLGITSVSLFVYFISRGLSPSIFKGFLIGVVSIFIAWIAVVFLKLNSRSEHSMFHLFSYICATEIIPLLITIKVLFQ